MKEIFDDILGIGGVIGAIFMDKNNDIKIEGYRASSKPDLNPVDLAAFINTIGAHEETEIHFDNRRLYIRKMETGYILVITDYSVQMAMVRLNCDVLEPLIESKLKKPTGIGRFFRK